MPLISRVVVLSVTALITLCADVAVAQTVVDGFDPGVNNEIHAIALQPDGKIVVGGVFTKLGGGGLGTTTRNYIGRLNTDGSLDTGFNPGANGRVGALTVQGDGKILVAGMFTGLGGETGTTPRLGIGRLNADGTVDHSFVPDAAIAGLGTDKSVVIQPDGKLLVARLNGPPSAPLENLGRLNADGSKDTGFTPLIYGTAIGIQWGNGADIPMLRR
jgi:uncharacterized delta-60 repeat protein